MNTNYVDKDAFGAFPSGRAWHLLKEDFENEYPLTSDLPVAATSPWVGTAAPGAGGTVSFPDGEFGVCVLSGAATTDNIGVQIQGDAETIGLVLGKAVLFQTRVKMSDATNQQLFVGLAITDTSLLDATGSLAVGVTASDAIGFYKPDDEATFYGILRRDSVQASTGTIGTMADDTYVVLSMLIQMDPTTAGKGYVLFYVNGTLVGRLDSTTMPIGSEELLTRSAAMCSGNATGTKTSTLDYLDADIER